MAEKGEMGNFGIEETLDMGVGDTQLLKDLMVDDASAADADDLKSIDDKIEEDDVSEKKDTAKKQVVTSKEEEDDDAPSGEELIDQFLSTNEEAEEEEEEDDEKEVGAKKKETDETGEDNEEVEEISFSALAKDLFNQGVFVKGEDEEDVEISTPEEFLERFNIEKKRGAAEWLDGFLGQFGEDRRQAFEAIFVNGVNPKDYFTIYNELEDFANIDLNDENNQKKVIKESLRDQGWENEDIEEELDRLSEIGDLEKVSQRHQKVLVKRDAKRLQEAQETAKVQLAQKQAIKEQYINNVKGILQDKIKTKDFDGIPMNTKFANELHDFLVVDKWRTASGETLTDFDRTILELKKPENHEMKVKLAALYKLLKKDPTLSTIQRSAISKKSNQIFDEVARQVTKKKGSVIDKKKSGSYFNYL